jgi:hypothetical protein
MALQDGGLIRVSPRSPSVSVVMPVNNGAETLTEAAAASSSGPVVRSSSSSWTTGPRTPRPDILSPDPRSSSPDRRVRIVRLDENPGVRTQSGIATSSGDFGARMDADDFSMQDRLAIQRPSLEGAAKRASSGRLSSGNPPPNQAMAPRSVTRRRVCTSTSGMSSAIQCDVQP